MPEQKTRLQEQRNAAEKNGHLPEFRPSTLKQGESKGMKTKTTTETHMGNRKCRCDRLGVVAYLIAVLVLAVAGQTLRAAAPPAGVANVINPTGGFDIDGDLIANTPTLNKGDWLPGPGGIGGSVLGPTGNTLVTNGFTFHIIDPYDNSDNKFDGGDKVNQNPNNWGWTINGVLGKDNMNNVLLHLTKDSNNHWWAIVAADRQKDEGTSYIDFEFLQNTLTTNAGGFVSTGPNCGRTTNDFLLTIPLTGGGTVPNFYFQKWLYTGDSQSCNGYDYVDSTISTPLYAAVNATNITGLPFTAFGGTTYASNTFAEAAVDLTALIAGTDPCNSIGVKTIMVKTKSAASSSANIFDFIWPIQVNFTIGLVSDAGPDQTKCNTSAGANQTCASFDLIGKGEPGINGIASMEWIATGSNNVGTAFSGPIAACNGNCSLDTNGNSVLQTNVSFCAADATQPASLTLSLVVKDTQNCYKTNDLVLTVNPSSPCTINYGGTDTVCPATTGLSFSKASPIAGETYGWNVVGGKITGGGTKDDSFVLVNAPTNCNSTLTVSLVVTNASGCLSTECTKTITIKDETGPVITKGTIAACYADVASAEAAALAATTANDACGGSVTKSASTTGTCSAVITVTVKDACLNESSTNYNTRIDNTGPVLSGCPSNAIYGCLADVPAAANVTANDNCDNSVQVNYNAQTNGTICSGMTITRTWSATDTCGNPASCTQVITVKDETGPVITKGSIAACYADVASAEAAALAATTASDACGSQVTKSASTIGTCSAVITVTVKDACLNESSTTYNTRIDNTPPALSGCPANASYECLAAVPAAANVTANDNCDNSVEVNYNAQTNGTVCSGMTITRTWSAADTCGNPTNCIQVITVKDETGPTITRCPQPIETQSCAVDLTLGVSTNAKSITYAEFVTAGGTAEDNCSAVTVSYKDSYVTQSCPIEILRTFTVKDACENETKCEQTIKFDDTVAPTVTCPTNTTIEGCNSSVISPAVGGGTITLAQFIALGGTATDACGLQTTVTYSDESLTLTGCEKAKVKRTFTVRDICDNPRSCDQTITVKDTIIPVVNSVPEGGDLECKLPPTDETIKGLVEATDNCTGTVTIDVSHQDAANGCDITRTVTVTASDACGNESEAKTVTYRFTRDSGGPSISLPAYEAFYCPGDAIAIGTPTVRDDCGVVSMTVIVTNGAGQTLAGPYGWDGSAWSPTWPTPFVLPAGSFGFVVTAVDKCGNASTETFKIRVLDDCTTHCSFTQGFYGNNKKGKGKFSWGGDTYTKSALVNALLGTNGIVVGTMSTGKYLKIDAGEADCIDARLPAGGPSAALEAGFGFTADDACGIVLEAGTGELPMDKQGRKFRNNLLGQTITLALNLRLDPTLTVFHLQSTLCTVGGGGDITSKTIPASVLAKLGSSNTVQDLLNLANKALGGDPTLSGILSDIGGAAGAINEAFDECRVAVPCDL